MKSLGMALGAFGTLAARGSVVEPFQGAAAQVLLPPEISVGPDQAQVFAGLSSPSRQLLDFKWAAGQITTVNGTKTYLIQKKKAGPDPGCFIDLTGPYSFGFSPIEQHSVFANCSLADGNVGQEWINLYTMPNGDRYVNRRDHEGAVKGLPCELDNLTAANRSYVLAYDGLVVTERCIEAPTVPTPSTEAPTRSFTNPPTHVPDAAQSGPSAGLIAGLAVVSCVAVGALSAVGCRLVSRRDQEQIARAIPLHDIEAQGQAVAVDLPDEDAMPPSGAAPQAGLRVIDGSPRSVEASPPYDEPPPPGYGDDAVVFHFNNDQKPPPPYEPANGS